MKSYAQLLGALLIAVLLVGCNRGGGKPVPEPDPAPVGPDGPELVPTNAFLYTGYEPLERWMEERFKVRYENMPLKMVFDQQPISDIRYQHVNLPEEAPVFQLISPSISRREILQEVAKFYNLTMNVQMVEGKPSYVTVQGRGPGGASAPVAPQQPAPAPAEQPAQGAATQPAPAPAPGGESTAVPVN